MVILNEVCSKSIFSRVTAIHLYSSHQMIYSFTTNLLLCVTKTCRIRPVLLCSSMHQFTSIYNNLFKWPLSAMCECGVWVRCVSAQNCPSRGFSISPVYSPDCILHVYAVVYYTTFIFGRRFWLQDIRYYIPSLTLCITSCCFSYTKQVSIPFKVWPVGILTRSASNIGPLFGAAKWSESPLS